MKIDNEILTNSHDFDVVSGVVVNCEHYVNGVCNKYMERHNSQFYYDYIYKHRVFDLHSVLESFLKTKFVIVESQIEHGIIILDLNTNVEELKKVINEWTEEQIKDIADSLNEVKIKESEFLKKAKEILEKIPSEDRSVITRYFRNGFAK